MPFVDAVGGERCGGEDAAMTAGGTPALLEELRSGGERGNSRMLE